MQGFVNFASDIAYGLAWVIPTICYLGGGSLLLASLYGFWQMQNPGSQASRRPFLPFITMFVAATLLSFDRMLTFANNTFGGGVSSSVAAGLTSYTAPTLDPSNLVGGTPAQTLLSIIAAFLYFFRVYGALIVLLAVFSFYETQKGNRNQNGHPLIQAMFGVAVMNVDTIAAAIIAYF
ncbi:MAG: hypothetical protein EON55_07185 [Alphaproteobacteria bacterium]|nr:MAG: hypothetical protein EON55_07185 [Alphaproteobacteria bacterium]